MGWTLGRWLFAPCRDSTKGAIRASRTRCDRCPRGPGIGRVARPRLGAAVARGPVTSKTADRRPHLRAAYRDLVGKIVGSPSVGSEFCQRSIGGAVSATQGCVKTEVVTRRR